MHLLEILTNKLTKLTGPDDDIVISSEDPFLSESFKEPERESTESLIHNATATIFKLFFDKKIRNIHLYIIAVVAVAFIIIIIKKKHKPNKANKP